MATLTFNNESITLCSFAFLVLVLPGSETICERCFSKLKMIHNHLRNGQKSDLLDCMLRIKLNLIWAHKMTEVDSIIEELNENEYEEEDEEEGINEGIDEKY